jgi:hypothetical protein
VIERLNFYDVYGYLLPGAALAGVLFLPYWFAGHPLPSSDVALGSAVTSLIVAYLAGHGVQIVGRRIFPEAHPSDTLITSERDGFKDPFRKMLQELLLADFKLDIFKSPERMTAFTACRYATQSKDMPSYAEQHQGLYALMRGLATVSLMGMWNYAGWILGTLAGSPVGGVTTPALSLLFLLFVFCVAFRPIFDCAFEDICEVTFWPPAALMFGTSIWFGFVEAPSHQHIDSTHLQFLIVAAAGLAFATYGFWTAFKYFQNAFATTVYITYFARRTSPLTSKASGGGGD